MLVDERYDFQFVTLQQLCMKCLRLEEVGWNRLEEVNVCCPDLLSKVPFGIAVSKHMG